MGYVRKDQQPGPMISAEQVRQRNAQMRLELVPLIGAQAQLEAKTKAVTAELAKARRKLTRQIKDLEAARIQAEQIAAHTARLGLPTYGGPAGLQAAADEIKAHEEQGLKLSKPARRGTGPSHGTARKYADGCKCVPCRAAKKAKDERYRTNLRRRLKAAA